MKSNFGTGKKLTQLHWTVQAAAGEFGLDEQTLSKAIKRAGIESSFGDGTFSTKAICRAIYSDKEAEQTRLTAANADIAEMEREEKRRNLVQVANVERVWNSTLADLRNKIAYAQIPQAIKDDLIKDLQDVPRDEYFKEAAKKDEQVET